MEIAPLLALSTGFIGGFGHCMGMCGPFVAAYTIHRMGRVKEGVLSFALVHMLFNLGRIATYTFIGALMGLSGSFINSAAKLSGLQNAASLIAGLFMSIMGLSIAGLFKGLLSFERYNSLIIKATKTVLQDGSTIRYIPLGLLIGLLPCGLSYSIFIASAGSGSISQGMLISFSFGLGTALPLILFGWLFKFIAEWLRGLIYRISGVVLTLMGIYYIYRGILFSAQV